MKKLKKILAMALTATMTLSMCVVPANAASVSWNFKNSGFKDLGTISSSVTVDSLKLIATSDKTMAVNNENSDANYPYCLATGGGGSLSYRAVNVPVTKSVTNTVKVTLRSTGSDTRTLLAVNPSGESIASVSASSTISTQSFTYSGSNSNIYLYSSGSNINIYKIQVDSADSGSGSSSGDSGSSSGSTDSSNALYVSTSGSDSNSGTSSSPLKTVAAAVSKASSGTTIYVASGTYNETSTLKLTKSMNIVGQGTKPTLNFSKLGTGDANRGIQISGSSCTIKNLNITNAGDNGIHISGSNNTVDDCYIAKCQDTGIQLSNGAANNTISNCTSESNYDDKTGGENADGFAAKLSIGSGNVFKKCIANKNSDDGYDFYEAGNAVSLYNCQANNTGVNNGNGNGFKVGGNFTADKHYLEGCSATGNLLRGYDQNNNTGAVTLLNCTGSKNKVNFYFPKAPSSGAHKFTGCVSTSGSSKDVVVGTMSGCSFNL